MWEGVKQQFTQSFGRGPTWGSDQRFQRVMFQVDHPFAPGGRAWTLREYRSMPENWDKTVAAAMKILGDKGKVPPMPNTLTSGIEKGQKTNKEAAKAASDLQSKVVEVQKSLGDVLRAAQQFQATIDKDNLGLDPKNSDEAKKIKQARGLLDGYFDTATKATSAGLEPATKLDNALSAFLKSYS
jgi:hypothetical protein